MEGNYGFSMRLLELLRENHNPCPVLLASSIQAEWDNAYGRSKKAGEELFIRYGREEGAEVMIYRLPNVFGKWCRPEYNSVVATFCHRIARGMPIEIRDESAVLELAYIDDVVEELIRAVEKGPSRIQAGVCSVPVTHRERLGEIARLLQSFERVCGENGVPDVTEGGFEKKLYSTYVSYLPEESLRRWLEKHVDERGAFTEILRTPERG